MSQIHPVPQIISRKVSPKWDIQKVSVMHYCMNCNMFAVNQIEQIGILIFKGRVPQPLVFPKSDLFPIMYFKCHPFKKILFYWHCRKTNRPVAFYTRPVSVSQLIPSMLMCIKDRENLSFKKSYRDLTHACCIPSSHCFDHKHILPLLEPQCWECFNA